MLMIDCAVKSEAVLVSAGSSSLNQQKFGSFGAEPLLVPPVSIGI
jgi:hypothetical protein